MALTFALVWALLAVAEHQLWRQHCLRAHPPVATVAAHIDASRIPTFSSGPLRVSGMQLGGAEAADAPPGVADGSGAFGGAAAGKQSARRSAFFKHLHFRLTAPLARESLIAEALAASSTDHPQVTTGGAGSVCGCQQSPAAEVSLRKPCT